MSSSGGLIRKGMNRNEVKNKTKKQQQKNPNLLNIQQLGADTQNEENRQPTVSVG